MPDSSRVRRGYRFESKWRTTTRQAVFARDGGCVVCLQQGILNAGSDGKGKGLLLSHVVAERQGGGNGEDNLVLLCAPHSGHIDGGRRYR